MGDATLCRVFSLAEINSGLFDRLLCCQACKDLESVLQRFQRCDI